MAAAECVVALRAHSNAGALPASPPGARRTVGVAEGCVWRGIDALCVVRPRAELTGRVALCTRAERVRVLAVWAAGHAAAKHIERGKYRTGAAAALGASVGRARRALRGARARARLAPRGAWSADARAVSVVAIGAAEQARAAEHERVCTDVVAARALVGRRAEALAPAALVARRARGVAT